MRSWKALLQACMVSLLVLAAALWSTQATRQKSQELVRPAFDDCLRGQELALHRQLFTGPATPAGQFMTSDESNYVRAAGRLAAGGWANDDVGEFISVAAAAPLDSELHRLSPSYRLSWTVGRAAGTPPPYFVAYRSFVFPALGAPLLHVMGCNTRSLDALRALMPPFRGLLVVAAAGLAALLAARGKALAAVLAAALVAADPSLDAAAAPFMPDVPGAVLLMLALGGLAWLPRQRSAVYALGLGGLFGLAALVKSDLIYVAPAAVLAAWFGVKDFQRRAYAWRLGVVLLAYALVMGAAMWRNHALTGAAFITSKDTLNLYLANTPQAPATAYRYAPSAAELETLQRIPTEHADQLRSEGPELALRSFCRRQFLALLNDHPLQIARMAAERAVIYLGGADGQHLMHRLAPLLPAGLAQAQALRQADRVFYGAVMAVALLYGLVLLLKRHAQGCPALPATLALWLSLGILSMVFVEPRYLSHVTALSGTLAACAIADTVAWLLRRVRSKTREAAVQAPG